MDAIITAKCTDETNPKTPGCTIHSIIYYLCGKKLSRNSRLPRAKKYETNYNPPGCTRTLHGLLDPGTGSEQSVLCIHYALKSIVEQIVGDDFEIQVIVPKGASPETFEPTPRQFVEINKARMIFSVGLIDFENSLINKIQDKDKIVNLSRGIQLIEGSCAHVTNRSATDAVANEGLTANRPEEHSHAHGVDPHIWTSPKALEIMARNAFDAIRTAYPDSIKYEENYKRLIQKIEKSDERVREKINRSGLKYFIIYHPALTYLARDYGICQVAIESEGKEPSARRLAGIIRQARQDGINKIFYQNQFPESVVEL